MAIPISEFWGENLYDHPPLTEEMIEQAERLLGVKLPDDYLELLRIQNGGCTQEFVFPAPTTSDPEACYHLHELNGIVPDTDHSTLLNVIDPRLLPCIRGEIETPLYKQVPLTSDGHVFITLDYRNGPVPAVAYIDIECDSEEIIAPSFAAFLDGLMPDPCVWE